MIAPVPSAPAVAQDLGLADSERILGAHLEAVRVRFGPAALGVIDLPSLGTGRMVPEQIRVCAVLYWASEVEAAALVPFVEALAEGVVTGRVVQPIGAAVHELARFWRGRTHRFAETERRALFARMFGEQAPFSDGFARLVRALVAIGRAARDQGTSYEAAQVGVLARDIGTRLSDLGTGIAAFAARDIVTQIRNALRLLALPDLAHAFGGGSPWQIVAANAPALLGRHVRPDAHVTRATAGLRIIEWIATEAGVIEAGRLRLDPSAAVIRDAEAWSAASGAA